MLSQSIVDFIGHLMPLYTQEWVGGALCARSLSDGTLVLPMEEPQGEEGGWVSVHWQGDPNRSTQVQGVYMASIAIARYVELHHVATHSREMRTQMDHFSHHFTVKTGESLLFEEPEESLMPLVLKAVGKFGETAVVEVLKKQLGL